MRGQGAPAEPCTRHAACCARRRPQALRDLGLALRILPLHPCVRWPALWQHQVRRARWPACAMCAPVLCRALAAAPAACTSSVNAQAFHTLRTCAPLLLHPSAHGAVALLPGWTSGGACCGGTSTTTSWCCASCRLLWTCTGPGCGSTSLPQGAGPAPPIERQQPPPRSSSKTTAREGSCGRTACRQTPRQASKAACWGGRMVVAWCCP